MKYTRLYAKTKTGAIKWWQIEVQEFATVPTIVISHATGLDGKVVSSQEEIPEGKNQGKANETTALEQARLEAESKWRKKRDQGYTEHMPSDEQSHNLNTLGLMQPMLALSIDKCKGELPNTVHVQPKLDGHRALVGWVDGELRMWSRRGKWIDTMEHILKPLRTRLAKHMILDGELYVHGEKLQNLGSLIKKQQAGTERVEYHVYDMILIGSGSTYNFFVRLNMLATCISDDIPGVVRVQTESCHPDLIQHFFRRFREAGYEGAMVRLDTKPYEPGYRSQALLKVKMFHDAEWTVRGVTRGIPKEVGGVKYDIAILDCGTFSVTAPGTVPEKDEVWRNAKSYIGRKVTVQYAHLTTDRVPFHPVALRFYDSI